MHAGQGSQALLKGSPEVLGRFCSARGLHRDGLEGGQGIVHAVVDLGGQQPLLLLGAPALGHVTLRRNPMCDAAVR